MKETEALDHYISRHIDAEHEYLYRLYRQTNISLLQGRMASGHLQGQLLKMLVEMIRPRNVLEIGTYTGYSALSMASGLDEGGMLYTFEINDEMEDFTRPWIDNSPWADRVRFLVGDVVECLPQIATPEELQFDMVFIDGDKRQYVSYYDFILPYLSPRAYILADNTLWDGHVVDPTYDNDAQTLGIRAFNDKVAADSSVEKVILPLRDGLTLIRRR